VASRRYPSRDAAAADGGRGGLTGGALR